jgi:23S rRNA (adenine2030-N6)-methyltransferase
MRYHHNFHAGNFADVHKHVALLALLDALQAKAKGFLYLDTHAASGLADLEGAEARRSEEAAQGWSRLVDAPLASPELITYRDTVRSVQQSCGARHYPGSPLLAASRLREQDRGIAVDSQAPTTRALERNLAAAGLERRLRTRIDNGFTQLAANWPPRERRALALLDPPYESPDELNAALEATLQGLERFETGVIAIWFPIKRARDLDRWLTRVTAAVSRPTLAALLSVHPLDSAAGLNGSGMLIVNPPYAMSQRISAWQDELRERLAPEQGASEVRWLVHER